ncbi:YqeG family HAD IIIA-type phosphatase [Sulfobacillus sp. hq2]|uniref:HAD family hydrolase n=1 Tax=Sulfobacillus thermotolerans TaxID=338644 RepID=A0ABN5H0G1_9FIRM|nr:YqeG family HAD IIIA-type phosphatase [Sulfobacillus sp. hq2]AUW93501.1 HAD family hydrolase [Sulfobacillus thermotolerans]MCY0908138.1 YqeG family HAD IIIA-type phosphatase [Sulfobacillus thermotolerans]POB10742.1 YqeG family HAD IIIA-type phosphatase [Sulfobacillus sp. hq2]
MIKILQPRLFLASIFDLDLASLKARGMRGLIMDLDNTLVGWNRPDMSQELIAWLQEVRNHGFKMCIVSNNLTERVEEFSRKSGIMSIPKAAKPRRRSFWLAMKRMGTGRHETAVIGDQVFTDILGGNRLKLYTILVHPIDTHEYWTTKLVRRLEGHFVRRPRRPQSFSH